MYGRKRKYGGVEVTCKKKRCISHPKETNDVSAEFLAECEEKFRENPVNIVARNAINSVGSMFSTINSTRVNELSYIFLNSVKHKHLKATNQGASGRCWMFAALNTFRHILINALDLKDFEFSEVYLFFWDKLERSNSYIRWFIDHPEFTPEDRAYEYMVSEYMSDGGWWNTFANLVQKYGLVPKSAMKETYQSEDSGDMNKIISERLNTCVNYICKNRKKLTKEQLHNFRESNVRNIYDTLVKFLGEPPKVFSWSFSDEDDKPVTVAKVTPKLFLDMVAPGIDMNRDFVALAHIPTSDIKFYQNYRVKYTNNVNEGEKCSVFNIHIDEMAKYAMKSISRGFAVWFVGDVTQDFNWFHSALDDKLSDDKAVFGETLPFSKGERINMKNIQGTHAMALTGFNTDSQGRPTTWQVENSWGYWDNETPGLDGFLTMSHSWFEKYVTQVVIHKKFLSRTIQAKIKTEPIDIDPWTCMAPAIRAGIVNPPKKYLELHPKKN